MNSVFFCCLLVNNWNSRPTVWNISKRIPPKAGSASRTYPEKSGSNRRTDVSVGEKATERCRWRREPPPPPQCCFWFSLCGTQPPERATLPGHVTSQKCKCKAVGANRNTCWFTIVCFGPPVTGSLWDGLIPLVRNCWVLNWGSSGPKSHAYRHNHNVGWLVGWVTRVGNWAAGVAEDQKETLHGSSVSRGGDSLHVSQVQGNEMQIASNHKCLNCDYIC